MCLQYPHNVILTCINCYIQTDPPQGIIDLAGTTVIRNSSKREYGFDITVRFYFFSDKPVLSLYCKPVFVIVF